MEFGVHRVSFSCYPRVQHAIKYLSPLSRRYDFLKNECSLMKYYPQIISTDYNFTEFFLCIQITDKGAPLGIQDVVVRNEKCVKLGKKGFEEVNDLVQNDPGAYFLLILNENEIEDAIPQNDRVKTVVVTENVKQDSTTTKSSTHNQNDSLKSKISDAMEENMYEAFDMKRKCEQLCTVLKENEMESFSSAKPKGGLESNVDIKPNGDFLETKSLQNERHNVQGIRKDQNWQRSKSAGHADRIADETAPAIRSKSAYERCEIEGFISDKLTELTELKKRKSAYERLLTEQMENIGRLYDEMIGMFCRSCVPKEKRPQTDEESNGTVSDDLKKELRDLSPHIRGCGYRCRSFHVFVDDEFDGGQLKQDIERILKNQNCLYPVVISSFSMKPLSSCNVGSNITAEFDNECSRNGTLGGFGSASSVEGNKIGLTSRHVVTDTGGKPASAIKVTENNANAKVLVDRSFQKRRKIVLDIAAVSFENCKIDLNTEYKTSEESLASGKITNLSREGMKGLPVHICGSKTPVGYGTITMPKIDAVQDKAMESFIIVEDRKNPQDVKKPFCSAGDSGAIVCADDQNNPYNVQLISMVMGENLKNPGTYYTIDLKDGIQQVEEEISSEVKLL